MTIPFPRDLLKSVGACLALLLVAGQPGAAQDQARAASPEAGPIVELRQYKIVDGKRDQFIPFFESHFVESQDAVGMRLIGQFRDETDPNRFTWIRQFPNMAARARSLTDFYYGPVWRANRAVANPMLDDNDNVLLLRPARSGSGFADPAAPRPPGREPARAGLVVTTIYYLWKDPSTGFSDFFLDKVAPRLREAGLPVVAAFVPEATPNNFPALPVRQNEKIFVWVTRVDDASAYRRALDALGREPGWTAGTAATLQGYQERPAQVLRLDPTPRSALR